MDPLVRSVAVQCTGSYDKRDEEQLLIDKTFQVS
jgi:hypothetical protein